MKQRFLIRLVVFAALSMVGALILLLLTGGLRFSSWLEGSLMLLCFIYSGRLLITYVWPLFKSLFKYGLTSIVLGSIPGIIIILLLLIFLGSILPLICFIVGIVAMLRELWMAVRMDRE